MANSESSFYDVIIYGATSAGVVAGIQACRMGKRAIVLEPGVHVGGLTTGGLGQTDIGDKAIVGGIAKEFYRGIRSHYTDPANWNWQRPEDYKDAGQTQTDQGEETMWTFEPSAARKVLGDMIRDAGLEVRTGARLKSGRAVATQEGRLLALFTEDGATWKGHVFIDASYEGDLYAAAGVSYRIGRESNDAFGETLNGVQSEAGVRTLRGQDKVSDEELRQAQGGRSPLYRGGLAAMASFNHQLNDGVDPYIKPGNPGSGLLPGIDPEPLAPNGSADRRIQAYNFRLTLTDHPDNRIPIEKPANYDPRQYEQIGRAHV